MLCWYATNFQMKNKPTKCIILSQPRTGSTLLCSLLHSVPGCRVLVEPINPRGHSHHMRPTTTSHCLLPQQLIQNNLYRALDILFDVEPPPSKWIASNKRAELLVGFKIMAHQIMALKNQAEFWEYLASHSIKIILCFRHNLLMQYVSDMITTVTKQSACWDGQVRSSKVTLDVSKLGAVFRTTVEQRAFLRNNIGTVHREIYYEDFKDSTLPVEDLMEWLIGQKHKLSTKLSKQNPDGLAARVHNYDEVVAEVRRLGFAHLLT
jgi:hypothetical protein